MKKIILLILISYSSLLSQEPISNVSGNNFSIEITSFIVFNNLVFYKPFELYQDDIIDFRIMTGPNFIIHDPFLIKNEETELDVAYDIILRTGIRIMDRFFVGVEGGIYYHYLASNLTIVNQGWREKLGFLLRYNLNTNYNLLLRISGSIKNASNFGIGIQYNL